MDELPGNSHKDKEAAKPYPNKDKDPEKDIQKVVSGTVVKKKKPFGSKIREVFVGGEIKSVGSFIFMNIVVPSVRNMLWDAITKGSERMIYGDGPQGVRRSGYTEPGRPRVQYNSPVGIFSPGVQNTYLPDQPPRGRQQRGRASDDIILETREDANVILESLGAIIDQYQTASIADLNSLLGIPSTFVDRDWGWESIASATIHQIREGYLINFPPLEKF